MSKDIAWNTTGLVYLFIHALISDKLFLKMTSRGRILNESESGQDNPRKLLILSLWDLNHLRLFTTEPYNHKNDVIISYAPGVLLGRKNGEKKNMVSMSTRFCFAFLFFRFYSRCVAIVSFQSVIEISVSAVLTWCLRLWRKPYQWQANGGFLATSGARWTTSGQLGQRRVTFLTD